MNCFKTIVRKKKINQLINKFKGHYVSLKKAEKYLKPFWKGEFSEDYLSSKEKDLKDNHDKIIFEITPLYHFAKEEKYCKLKWVGTEGNSYDGILKKPDNSCKKIEITAAGVLSDIKAIINSARKNNHSFLDQVLKQLEDKNKQKDLDKIIECIKKNTSLFLGLTSTFNMCKLINLKNQTGDELEESIKNEFSPKSIPVAETAIEEIKESLKKKVDKGKGKPKEEIDLIITYLWGGTEEEACEVYWDVFKDSELFNGFHFKDMYIMFFDAAKGYKKFLSLKSRDDFLKESKDYNCKVKFCHQHLFTSDENEPVN